MAAAETDTHATKGAVFSFVSEQRIYMKSQLVLYYNGDRRVLSRKRVIVNGCQTWLGVNG
jgi:hypothetical protein